jgi:protein-disulfide isomerase
MIFFMRLFATCAILLALACTTPAQQAAPAQQSAASAGSSEVAARIGDRAITLKELDDRWRQDDPAQQAQAMQAVYEGRRGALEAIVAQMLIEQAAKAKGIPADQFTDAEITRRVKPVTEGQIVSFFQENQSQMQGRPLQAMSPVIRNYLEEQERANAYRALVAELRKGAPPVTMVLDAPRSTIAIEADDPTLGPATAPVTLVEFSDFQCPFCQRVEPTLKRIRETYGDRVRIVWKDFPLTQIHPQAFKAAEAAHCAREQGKFWEYHDRLFANQQALQVDALKQHASALKLDTAKFNDCLDSAKYAERVQAQMGVGAALGVNSTPAVFVNGRLLSGAQPFETFAAVIDEELERAKAR